MVAAMTFLNFVYFTYFKVFCVYLCLVASSVHLSEANMFGTKTRYADSLPSLTKKVLTELSNRGPPPLSTLYQDREQKSVLRDQIPKGSLLLNDICRPVHINFLGRHGIRNPGHSDIKTIRNLMLKLKNTKVDSKLVSSLEKSIASFTVDSEKELTPSGWKELSGISERFILRFPELFKSVKSDEDLLFQVTSKSRTVDSCKAFMSSLVKSGVPVSDQLLQTRDDLLRFFDTCEKYVVEVDENKNALSELERFREKYFAEIGENIMSKMGVGAAEHFVLSHGEVKAIYVIAASELAVHNTSTWGQLLGPTELRYLEYAADLKNYWKKSYGYPINYEQSCSLLGNMLSHLEMAANNGNMKGVFSFAHAETFLPFISLLGLFRDDLPLTADSLQDNRHFKTSTVSPFAANLALVLYSCDVSMRTGDEAVFDELGQELTLPPETAWSPWMVRMLFNEQDMLLPSSQSHLIPLHQALKRYSQLLKRCDWNEMCSLPKDEL